MTLKRWALAAVIALFVCGDVLAEPLGTVHARYQRTFTHGTVKVWGAGRSGRPIRAGLSFLRNDADAATGAGEGLPDEIPVFCIDLEQSIRGGYQTYDVIALDQAPHPGTYIPDGPAMGADRADYLAELWGRYFADAAGSRRLAEAFSVAVWEILYEPMPMQPAEWDVTSGPGFRCKGVDTDTANAWLHSLGDPSAPRANLQALSHLQSQDLITSFPTHAPEPMTMGLLATGGLALLKRRR